MNNKEKNTRIVTFKEDYQSAPGKLQTVPETIYRKGSTHAIHYSIVKKLEAKGVKMDVRKHDPEPIIKRLKAEKKANQISAK